MKEIAPNRYVKSDQIIGAKIYEKDGKIRVAIDLNTINPDEKTVFSGQMATIDEAKTFIGNLAN